MQSKTTITAVRYAALGLGLLFLVLGIAGFVPAFVVPSENFPTQPGFGYLFGVFPTNYFHNALGILVGIWGIAAFTSLTGSIVFNRIFGVLYIAGAVLGLLPFTSNLFGIVPLFGNNIWLDALVGAIAFYHGFLKPAGTEIPGIPGSMPQSNV